MRYAILGTTQALRDDGTSVPLAGGRLRALLTALALRPGRVTGADALIDEVWDGDPPAGATGALQALVGRLRRALGHAAVGSVEGGYRLEAARDDVDLYRFERLTEEGARALADDDPVRAVGLLGEALALWHGPALADLPDRGTAAIRAEALQLGALRQRLTAELALGRAGQALPELAELAAAHPLDEPVHALWMRALRDTGRTADALGAYESVRRTLADELGADPSAELRALHAELLNPAPLPDAAAGGPDRQGARANGHRDGEGGPAGHASGAGHGYGRGRRPESAFAGDDGGGAYLPAGAVTGDGARPGRGSDDDDGAGSGRGRGPASGLGSGDGEGAYGAAGAWQQSAFAGDDGADARGREAYGRDARGREAYDRDAHGRDAYSPSGGAGHGGLAGAAGGRRSRAAGGNARARLTSFVGRESDLETVRGDLARARLVTITGPGGTGKTRLSQEAGDQLAGRWPDGVWYVELAPVSDPATVPEAVISSLGLRETLLHTASAAEAAIAVETKSKDATRQLADYCAGRSLLLVLDNCEHVIDAAASLAEQLLADCPGLAVLATSREPLGVPGELVRPLDPLPDPTAIRLLADRGAAARPGFSVEEDPEACAELCRRLDGLPLAIELAAARLRSLSPRQLADRLDDRFRLLTGGSRTLLPRQQTLRAVVDWSWDLMERPERVLLRRLAVFHGGWTLEAVEAVCADPEPARDGEDAPVAAPPPGGSAAGERIDAPDAAALLASLVDKSLVLAEQSDDGVRYRMLETIAEYAAERLAGSGERAAVQARHTAYFREYVRTADPKLRGTGQLLWFERLEREHENLRAALRRAIAAGDEQQALQLVIGCSWFWEVRNYVSERRTWPAAVAAMGPDPFASPLVPEPLERGPLDDPPPMEGERLREARRWVRLIDASARDGDGQWFGDPDLGRLGAELVQAYPPHLPQSARQPGIMRPFGAFFTGDYTRLRTMVDETVQACRTHNRPWELAFSLQMRAKINNDVGELLADSLRDIGESRRLFQQIGDEWGAAETLVAEAEASINGGKWEHAIECCRDGIALVRKIGSEQYIPVLTVRMGDATISTGRPEEGERLLREGIAQAERFGAHSDGAAFFGRMMLALHLGRGDRVDEALDIVDRALTDTTAAEQSPDGAHGFAAAVIKSLKGYLVGRSGDPRRGLDMIAEGIGTLSRHPLAHLINPRLPIMLTPGTVELLTLLAEEPAHVAEAAAPRAGGPDTRAEAAERAGQAESADGSGGAGRARRRARRAATLIGVHDRLRPSAVAPAEAERLDELRVRLRSLLGEEEYEAAYAEGDGPWVEETVALMRDVD